MDNFPDRGPSVFTVTTTTLIIATIFVFARVVSRVFVVKNFSLDDWLMVLAWILAFSISFSIDFGTSKGLGRHDVNIKSEWIPELRRSEYAFSVLYNPALMATKSSLLVFYLRLSRNTKPLLRIASYITLSVVNIAGIVLTFLCILQCSPISAAFTQIARNAQCISLVTLYLTSAPVNIITDLAILVLPIPVLTSMRLPPKQKHILIATFGLGIFVTIVDVIRIYYLQQASVDFLTGSLTDVEIGDQAEFAWYASLALMWTAVEVNIGIICGCVPTLKPLILRFGPHWIDHVRSRSNSSPQIAGRQGPSLDPDGAYERQLNLSPLNISDHPSDVQPPMRSIGDELTADGRRDSMQDIQLRDFGAESQARHFKRSETLSDTLATNDTTNTVYFGFVNMKRPRSMLKTRGKETLRYCTIVTILFFLWGFSSGLLNVLNNQIAEIAHESASQTLGLTGSYWGAYLFGPILGWYLLKVAGFKATFITGLCIYGVGTLMWWPSAVLQAFPGFFVSNFVVGFGLSILETAANPFLALCGPEEYSELRLLLAQGVQGFASVIAPLLAQKVFFRNVNRKPSLIDVQWAYLAISLFDVILALFFYYMPLPEVTDAELEEAVSKTASLDDLSPSKSGPKFFGKYSIVLTTLAIGTTAQFLYVAAQEGMTIFVPGFFRSITTELPASFISSDNFSLISQSLFTFGRFLFAGLTVIIAPRLLLLISFLGAVIFSIIMVSIPAVEATNTNAIAAASLLVFFFEGPMFPLIFAISLRGLGHYTKAGSALLTAAACGGGISPFPIHAVMKKVARQSNMFIIVVGLFALASVYPVYLNVVKRVKELVDSPKVRGMRLSWVESDGSRKRFSDVNMKIVGKK